MIPGVPYDAEVEYIHVPPNGWIDTGWTGGLTDQIRFRCLLDITNYNASYDTYFGSFMQADLKHALLLRRQNLSSSLQAYFNTGRDQNIVFDPPSGKLDIDISYGNFLLNGSVLKTSFMPFTMDTAMYIGAVLVDGDVMFAGSEFDLYAVQGFNAFNILTLDLIPVRFTNEQGQSEGAMYDRVSKRLFRNQGTGAFVIGPDVATPVMGLRFFKPEEYVAKSYVQDGLVAMWDGIENVGFRKHSYATETWKDLTGNGNDATIVKSESYSRSAPFDATAARMDGTFSFSFTPSQELISALQGSCTVEIIAILGVPTLVDNVPYIGLGPYNTSIMAILGTASKLKARPYINNEVQCIGGSDGDYPFRQRAFVKEMDGSSAVCTWYRRGAFDKQESRTFQTATATGGYLFGNGVNFFGGSGRYWNSGEDGYAYGIRVYNRALTQSELAANYAIDKARFNLP